VLTLGRVSGLLTMIKSVQKSAALLITVPRFMMDINGLKVEKLININHV